MKPQAETDFQRISDAIAYLQVHFKEQPSLEEVARQAHLSPFHFQRLFTDWAGVSPKKFLQFITVKYARSILQQGDKTVFDAAYESGLSGTGRLHDLFLQIEGMTPGEFKNGGAFLNINYRFANTQFGKILVASTAKGICHMSFADVPDAAFHQLQNSFPNARFHEQADSLQQDALAIFSGDWQRREKLKLHLKGTPFQLKVWETLLTIPVAGLRTYGQIAASIQQPAACRAVGTAIAQNPVAFLIPCHRVIQSSGTFGNYHWGTPRKTAMIGWEAVKNLEAIAE